MKKDLRKRYKKVTPDKLGIDMWEHIDAPGAWKVVVTVPNGKRYWISYADKPTEEQVRQAWAEARREFQSY